MRILYLYFIRFFVFLGFGCLASLIHSRACAQGQTQVSPPRILMVMTSVEKFPGSNKPTGAYFSEIVHPYRVFERAHFEVVFVSLNGGSVPLDGLEINDTEVKRAKSDKELMSKLRKTSPLDSVETTGFSAIFLPGGHGTMFDFPLHPHLSKVLLDFHKANKVIAAVCHGPAAFTDLKLPSGDFFVKDRQISAFTNEEEEAVQLTSSVPFLLESKLREQGALFTKSPPFKRHVSVDDHIVTGQNPESAVGVAEAVVRLLKRKK